MAFVVLVFYDGLARSPSRVAAPAVDVSKLAPIEEYQKMFGAKSSTAFPKGRRGSDREMRGFKKCRTLD